MKRYKIIHVTHYEFTHPVQLLPHTFRLRPREGHDQRIESSALNISPNASLRWQRDVEGNSVATAGFNQKTKKLTIESEIIIQKYDLAPQDFLLENYAVNYPFNYTAEDKLLLNPYIEQTNLALDAALNNLIMKVWLYGQAIQTFDLLLRLNQQIYQTIGYCIREEEGVQAPEYTLSNSSGSCRDSAFLFMTAARKLGFAARFVSGYVFSNTDMALSGSTHAWAEVFLPGAGWKGFDPTTGSIVGPEHIAVAVARHPESVPPIAGSYLGPTTVKMSVDVWVHGLTK